MQHREPAQSAAVEVPAEPRRRGLVDGTWVVLRLAGISLLRGRRGLALAALGLLPLIPVIVGFFGAETGIKGLNGFVDTVSESYFRLVNLLACLFLGCAALGEEIDGRTLPYLLTRAVPRTALLLGRYLSYLLSATLLIGGYFVTAYALTVAPMGLEAVVEDLRYLVPILGAAVLTAAAYGAVFLLLTVMTKKPILIGLGLLFFWESFAVGVAGRIKDLTVLHHAYVLLQHWTEHARFVELARLDPEEMQSVGGALQVLLSITVVALAIAAFRFRGKEYTFN